MSLVYLFRKQINKLVLILFEIIFILLSFIYLPLILAFSMYFCFFHSSKHIIGLARELDSQNIGNGLKLFVLKANLRKDVGDGLFLDGLKKLFNQNVDRINMIVNSLKKGLMVKKDDPPAVATAAVTAGRTTKLTKPAKVPSWSQDMMMATFIKQLERNQKT